MGILWVFAVTGNVIMAIIAYRRGWMLETFVAILVAIFWGLLLWPFIKP